MSKHKPDEALDRLRSANPAPAPKIEAQIEPDDRARLRERAIERGESEAGGGPGSKFTSRRGRRLTLRIAGVAAGIAVLVGAALIGFNSPGGDERPAFAAEAIEAAEANPRLLVTEPGWSVTDVNWQLPDDGTTKGSMIFKDGERRVLWLDWFPADGYRERERKNSVEISLLGEQATLFPRRASDGTRTRKDRAEFLTVVPPIDGTFVEIRGELGSKARYLEAIRYLEVIRSLEPTDVETWLSALPPDAVQPGALASAVEEMLEGIPLPPDFDREVLEQPGPPTLSNRYQLSAYVTQAVVCGWLDRLTDAHAGGDRASEREAIAALLSSKDWPILREMNSEGGWPIAVWEYADYVAGGNIPESREEYDQQMNCIEFR